MERKCLIPIENHLTLNKWYRIIDETEKEFIVINDLKNKWSYPKQIFEVNLYRATPSEVKQLQFFSSPDDLQFNFEFPKVPGEITTENNSVLLEAEKIVNGDRNDQYGDPKIAFGEYASILKITFGIELSPEEICKVLMAIKLGRLKHKYKRDSIVDLCGYSEILNRLENE